MQPLASLVGQRFGRLTVVRQSDVPRRLWKRYWVCRCDCGGESTVATDSLRSGNTGSCGCMRREIAARMKTRHGHARRRGLSGTYVSWYAMKDRCLNPNHSSYANYGGRGVRVCERWLAFEGFLADMGERPSGTSIDRLDSNGGYKPGNCRWADAKTQGRNRRTVKLSAAIASEIRALLAMGTDGPTLAARFNVSVSLVRAIRKEEVWQ